MTKNFTPGPWELDDHIHASGNVWGPDGQTVCQVTDRGGTTPYNARLIAAAPDLYAVCLTFQSRFAGTVQDDVPLAIGYALSGALDAAISKADHK